MTKQMDDYTFLRDRGVMPFGVGVKISKEPYIRRSIIYDTLSRSKLEVPLYTGWSLKRVLLRLLYNLPVVAEA